LEGIKGQGGATEYLEAEIYEMQHPPQVVVVVAAAARQEETFSYRL